MAGQHWRSPRFPGGRQGSTGRWLLRPRTLFSPVGRDARPWERRGGQEVMGHPSLDSWPARVYAPATTQRRRAMIGYPVIDADGHVNEPWEAYRARLPAPYNAARSLFPGDGWDRGLGRMGHVVDNPQRQLADMDVEGIDVAVLFP